MLLKELIEERLKLIADMRALNDAAEDGILTPENEEKYQKLEEREEQVSRSIERQERLAKTEAANEERATTRVAGSANSGNTQESARRIEEMKMRCFRTYLANGTTAAMNTKEFQELRSLNAGLITEGGAFIPPMQFVNEVIQAVTDAVYIRGLARVFTVQNAGSLGFPTLTTRLNNFDWTTEITTPTKDESMRTGMREFKPQPMAKLVQVSRKLLAKTGGSVESMVRDDIARALAETEEYNYILGAGASGPLGLMTPSDSGIPTSRDTSEDMLETDFTADALINAEASLKSQYAAKATWMFHRLGVKRIRKLKDGEGQYLWQPGLTAGTPDTLLTHPVVKSEFFPSTFTTGQYVGIIGDFSKYYIVDDAGTFEMQRLVELFALSNEDGFIVRKEGDGMPVLAEAFTRIKTA